MLVFMFDVTLQLACTLALSDESTLPNVDIAFVLIALNPNINLSRYLMYI